MSGILYQTVSDGIVLLQQQKRALGKKTGAKAGKAQLCATNIPASYPRIRFVPNSEVLARGTCTKKIFRCQHKALCHKADIKNPQEIQGMQVLVVQGFFWICQ